MTRRAEKVFRAALACCAAVAVAGSSSASSAPPPARSGTILGGYFPGLAYLGGSPRGCDGVPECAAWKASGCRPDLSGRDPAVHASIVNVRGLGSRSRTWTFAPSSRSALPGAPSLVWGGLTVQLWTRACRPAPAIGDDAWEGVLYSLESRTAFRMPPSAEWMTVTSSDNTTMAWTLS